MSDIARLTVAALEAHGFERLFCLPGVQNDDFFDALFDAQDRLPPIVARHEQACSYMAAGAEQASGRPQAYCVVPGQGVLNAAAGHSVAHALGARVLALIGQIPTGMIGRGFGALHEIEDQTAALRTISKRIEAVRGSDGAVEAMARAMRAVTSGRPGTAVLEVPATEWAKPVDWDAAALQGEAEVVPLPEAQLDAAAAALARAQRPVILAGGGARDASPALTALAEALGAPVSGGLNGKGAIDARHPLWLELPAMHRLWPEADVALGVGTRLLPLGEWGVDEALTTVLLSATTGRSAPTRPAASGSAL
ncbi:MAG: thiamine pyrophosphate-binding protein, partial [Pseudomonadota bacterium]